MPEVPLSAVPGGKPCKRIRQEKRRIKKAQEREFNHNIDKVERKKDRYYEPIVKTTGIDKEREHLNAALSELPKKKAERRKKATDAMIAVRFREVEPLDRFYPKEGDG